MCDKMNELELSFTFSAKIKIIMQPTNQQMDSHEHGSDQGSSALAFAEADKKLREEDPEREEYPIRYGVTDEGSETYGPAPTAV